MSAACYLDLMEACKLDVDRLQAEHEQTAKAIHPKTIDIMHRQRGLVTEIGESNGVATRQVVWAIGNRLRCNRGGHVFFEEISTRYLLPATLCE